MTEAATAADKERDRQREAAIAFGVHLRRWRRRQGWAQDTAMQWGQAIEAPHVYSSQWSQLETGSMRNPSPGLFCCLGLQNQQLADADFGPIRDRTLRDRVTAAEAVGDDDGPWTAVEFFACYIGHRDWPAEPEAVAPEISDDDATAWSNSLRDWFRRTAEAGELEPLEAAVDVMRHVPEDEEDDRQLFQRVLLGFENYQPAELLDEWRREAPGARRWISEWRRTLGLKGDGPVPPWEA